MAVNVWERTAEMLESGQTYPSDDIDAEVRKLIRERPWLEVGAILADTHRELRKGSTEAEAVRWAADLVHVLRPMGWQEAPEGPELERAIMAAWR
jgi:hypothetical protein